MLNLKLFSKALEIKAINNDGTDNACDTVKVKTTLSWYGYNADKKKDIATSEVSIIASDGAVIVKGAAGKNVVITNVLDQTVANTVVSSDEATIAAPAGVVV